MRVILADDAVMIRQGLARLLADEGVEVVAQVGDADALLEAVDRETPDAVVVDIRMPPDFSDEGLRAAQALRTQHPSLGVLVLSQHIDTAYAMRLLTDRSERVGYLLKDRIADVATLVSALERVCASETVVDPDLVAELLNTPRHHDPLAELTPREREVLALIAEGCSDRGIAEQLWLSPKTIETHVRTIFRKLDLPSSHSDNRRVHAVLTFLGSATRN